jgi:predicted AlkP superfamily phosphohydrolase/phosphomutase
MSNSNQKLVLIGLDGATFRVLHPLIDAGVMPTLARFMREGASGVLLSTHPPVTCPAWPTMFTGVNPAKHGVYSFSFREPKNGRMRTARSTDIAARKIWNIIGDAGNRVCVFNVPITFPAEKVNGVMLTGFVSPEDSPYVTWPQSLSRELRDKFTDLCLNWEVLSYRPSRRKKREKHIRRINELMALRCRQFDYLTSQNHVDFCFLVHEYTDRVNHLFYHLLDPACQAHRSPANRLALKLLHDGFRELDALLARLQDSFGNDTNYIFVSDHGFDRVNQWVYVNNLLAQHGLLTLKGLKTWADVVARHLHIPNSVRLRLGFEERQPWHRQDPSCDLLVDYTRTRAFAGPQLEHAVYVNLKGKYPRGTVEPGAEYERTKRRIIDVLSAATDPRTGKPVFEQVWAREQIYEGPHLQNAPDVIYEVGPGYMVSNAFLPSLLLRGRFLRSIRSGWNVSGYHRPDGIFIASGPAFRNNERITASILDIAPTVLYLMDVPIPTYMDGRVLKEAINPELLRTRTPRTCDCPLTVKTNKTGRYSTEEEMEMTRRLSDLGYL